MDTETAKAREALGTLGAQIFERLDPASDEGANFQTSADATQICIDGWFSIEKLVAILGPAEPK